jgi:hypothetical protein
LGFLNWLLGAVLDWVLAKVSSLIARYVHRQKAVEEYKEDLGKAIDEAERAKTEQEAWDAQEHVVDAKPKP